MDIGLRLYENPTLVTRVNPGQIIEALPSTGATKTVWMMDPIKSSPTNVFGYVRGILREDSPFLERQGDTLVERVVPFGGTHIDEDFRRTKNLEYWCTGDAKAYFVIGEITNFSKTEYEDKYFSPILMDGSVTLSPAQIDVVRNELLGFVNDRKEKGYVFNSPDGNSYSLKDVVFSLEEKK